jgi:RNA polymerase sigma-70 factor (ECF subfamily)
VTEPDQDWATVLGRVLRGDPVALLRVARLVNGFLVRWNAYQFRDEWEDLTQEVVTAAAIALRDGKLRDPQAALGFLHSTARFKYVNRLRIQLRLREGEELAWGDALERSESALPEERRQELRRALERVPEKARRALLAVYVDGRTYEDAARETGIPLGSLKRYLRDGLAQLRVELAGNEEGG